MDYNSGFSGVPPRRAKTPSLPLTSSDSVSEWSKKIREIQKEVDADEEAERKKLEDEIAASRAARASRRNTVIAGSGVINDSGTTPTSGGDLGSALTRLSMSEGPGATSPKPNEDMSMLGRSDALRKLVGNDYNNSQGGSSSSSATPLPTSQPTSNSSRSEKPYDYNAIRTNVPGSKQAPSKGETMSLAAFMGSKATGPRLNKAPTQEEYDPDLYAPRPNISGPHPIFGRARDPFEKGKPMHTPVPLPGMVRKTSPAPPQDSPVQTKPADDWEPNPVEPLTIRRKSGGYQSAEDKARRFSDDWEPQEKQTPPFSGKVDPEPPTIQPATPIRSTTTYDEFGSPSTRVGITPETPSSITKTASAPPALARSIQPSPKPPVSPQVAVSTRQSPAFLKAPQQKDLTPSLSKLQGRGFVAQRINASETMDNSREQSASPIRKGGVLSRWPPASNDPQTFTPTSPPPESPTRSRALSQIERDREAGIFPGSNAPPQQQRQQSQPRLGPGAVPLPSMAKTKSPTAPARLSNTFDRQPYEPPAPPVALPGLANTGTRGPSKSPVPVPTPSPGPIQDDISNPPAPALKSQRTGPGSATTMISFIRPQKTGQSEKSAHNQEHDDGWDGSTSKSVDPASTSAPVLYHPTKGRAKKPQAMTKKPVQEVVSSEAPTLVDYTSVPRGTAADKTHSDSKAFVKVEHAPAPSPLPEQSVSHGDERGTVKKSIESFDDVPNPRLSAMRYPPVGLPSVAEESASASNSRESTIKASRLEDRYQSLSAKNLEKEVDESSSEDEVETTSPPKRSSRQEASISPPKMSGTGTVVAVHEGNPVKIPDITQFLNIREEPFRSDPTFQPISTEAFGLQGSQPLKSLDLKPLIVYDAECAVVVYRVKSRTTGLASTQIFCWTGKAWQENAHERRKLNDLSSRHNSLPIYVPQGGESAEFLNLIGNTLVTREGSRGHWSTENMTMHRTRRLHGAIMIDELPFEIGNLCAGFSYIITMLGNIYVWHGKGSLKSERSAASSHAQRIKGEAQVIEVKQGKEDETFWMMLGEGFSSADYWRHRTDKQPCDPRFFEVVAEESSFNLRYRSRFTGLDLKDDGILVADCFFELFVIIGSQARDNRACINAALSFAGAFMDSRAQQPFPPPAHVIILPSQLPAELRMALRFTHKVDESGPQHMNILTMKEAVDHLSTSSWTREQLSDENFLPLGMSPAIR